MNKVTTSHVSGLIFNIEEDAYDKLKKYLDATRAHFSGVQSGNEVYEDIEARIAEIFQERVNAHKQVILLRDVEEMIEAMGRPEQFSEENKGAPKPEGKPSAIPPLLPIKKRVFRDPDAIIIGGVCSGLAAYFDVDPIWIRLAFILLFLISGTGLILYIILWFCIPKARTAGQKLQMHHQPVNLVSIQKTFSEQQKSSRKIDSFGQIRSFFSLKRILLILFILLFGFIVWKSFHWHGFNLLNLNKTFHFTLLRFR